MEYNTQQTFPINKWKLIHRHLTPDLLARYLYPKLAAYKNADTLDIPRLNLAQRTLLAMCFMYINNLTFSDRPIYVYISHNRIIVYVNGEKTITVHSVLEGSSSFIWSLIIVASLGASIQRYYHQGESGFPIRFEFWNSEENCEEFKKLMVDDNADPTKCFNTMETSIVDTAIKLLKSQ